MFLSYKHERRIPMPSGGSIYKMECWASFFFHFFATGDKWKGESTATECPTPPCITECTMTTAAVQSEKVQLTAHALMGDVPFVYNGTPDKERCSNKICRGGKISSMKYGLTFFLPWRSEVYIQCWGVSYGCWLSVTDLRLPSFALTGTPENL